VQSQTKSAKANPRPAHWDRSFEWVFIVVFAILGLLFILLLPSVIPLLAIIAMVAGILALAALLVAIGISIWRFFFAK
jgi:hypothetical protein